MDNIIKSISYDQHEILRNIITLHVTEGFECDVTYGSGNFYKNGVPRPKFCFDLNPRKPEVMWSNVCALPLESNSIYSIVFDPPFMARTGPGATLKERFGELIGTINDLWNFYERALREIHRVLKPGGWLVFKCQDGVLSGVNNFTHAEIMKRAEWIGFKPIDLFILLAKHRMMHPAHKVQKHARKYHSYFWVMRKS